MWQQVPESYEMVKGETYRARWIIQSPYPGSLMRTAINGMVNGVDRVDAGITIKGIDYIPPGQLAYIPKGGWIAGRYQPWELCVTWSKGAKGGTPMLLVIGVVAAALVGLGIISILNRSAERFVESTGSVAPKIAFSGIALIASVVGAFLIMSRR